MKWLIDKFHLTGLKKGNSELKHGGDAKWKETGVSRVESTCHIQLSGCLINIKF